MIKSNEIFIPVFRERDHHASIIVNNDEVKNLVEESEWTKPATISLGFFRLKLKNASGRISGKYLKGHIVKFYADNTDGTRLQFQGRIDYPKEIISREGQWLEIEGRHRAYILNEIKVCHSTAGTATDTGQILKDIMDKYAPGFTYNNVATSGITTEVEWNYVPFWDCVLFLCKKAAYDAYVDNDLDMHFFEQNSIQNENEAIVEGMNFLKTAELGTDDYYEKTRVIALGETSLGLPIIYTAISDGEGSEIREVKVQDVSANTFEKVKALADAELLDLENRPIQASMTSYGLETLEPGEVIWIVVPRQQIYGQYRIIQLKHRFGQKTNWITECTVEKEIIGNEEILRQRIRTENMISKLDNVNKLDFTYNFEFENDDDTLTHEQTQVNEGQLELSNSSFTTGTWKSKSRIIPADVTEIELRYAGKDLTSSKIYFSLGGGVWQQFGGRRILTIPTTTTGTTLSARVDLVKNDSNPWPTVQDLDFLYSYS